MACHWGDQTDTPLVLQWAAHWAHLKDYKSVHQMESGWAFLSHLTGPQLEHRKERCWDNHWVLQSADQR